MLRLLHVTHYETTNLQERTCACAMVDAACSRERGGTGRVHQTIKQKIITQLTAAIDRRRVDHPVTCTHTNTTQARKINQSHHCAQPQPTIRQRTRQDVSIDK